MRKLITLCAVVAALALFAGNVQAGGCGHGGYGGYSGYGGFSQSHMSSGYGGYGGYGFVQPHQDWHNTSHYDYHPTQVMQHGNHYHVTPGHYDYHQTGHYDLHW